VPVCFSPRHAWDLRPHDQGMAAMAIRFLETRASNADSGFPLAVGVLSDMRGPGVVRGSWRNGRDNVRVPSRLQSPIGRHCRRVRSAKMWVVEGALEASVEIEDRRQESNRRSNRSELRRKRKSRHFLQMADDAEDAG